MNKNTRRILICVRLLRSFVAEIELGYIFKPNLEDAEEKSLYAFLYDKQNISNGIS